MCCCSNRIVVRVLSANFPSALVRCARIQQSELYYSRYLCLFLNCPEIHQCLTVQIIRSLKACFLNHELKNASLSVAQKPCIPYKQRWKRPKTPFQTCETVQNRRVLPKQPPNQPPPTPHTQKAINLIKNPASEASKPAHNLGTD